MGSKCRCFHMLFHLKNISLNVFPAAQLNHLFEGIMLMCLVSSCSTKLLWKVRPRRIGKTSRATFSWKMTIMAGKMCFFLNVQETLGSFQNQEPDTSPRKSSSYPVTSEGAQHLTAEFPNVTECSWTSNMAADQAKNHHFLWKPNCGLAFLPMEAWFMFGGTSRRKRKDHRCY